MVSLLQPLDVLLSQWRVLLRLLAKKKEGFLPP